MNVEPTWPPEPDSGALIGRFAQAARARAGRPTPTVRAVVLVDHVGLPADPAMVSWAETIATAAPLRFERVDFDAPLWVLFSSGITGVPKGIVHGHGGVLLEHLKLTGLHLDLRAGKRFFWYTTTNWMMWNLVVAGLLAGATIMLYDGSPVFPDAGRLWALTAELGVSVLGVSPGYLLASAKAGVEPAALDLSALRVIGSTGAPLPAACYHWVSEHVGAGVQLAYTTGGVRLGSADLYAVVENLPEIREALVIGAEQADGGYWMPLFVVLEDGVELDQALRNRINTAIRVHASPRHVPDTITAVPGIPHTRTGKKLEIPVKRLLQGASIDQALARDAVDNPELLDFYARLTPPADGGDDR